MRYAALFLVLLALITIAAAAPVGTTASLISNNNATFSATSAEDVGWFEYGMSPATLNVWTPNQTAAGAFTWTEIGSPLTSGITYWVAGCDTTGCDATPATFTMLAATPLPSTTFGYLLTNATKGKFNSINFLINLPLPYTWLFPESARALAISIVVLLVLFAIFYGYAARTRTTAIVLTLGTIAGPYLLYANQGMNLGIPVEAQGIAQGIFYGCLAGWLLVILRK